ncbi:UBX domain-containing 2 isoform X1 [Micractinium conductrix]|uniref:UBX domain-containing 2 isoform X1 n=1 Tax=Micractinium conductrix TaxID=554055 RepID=A0A2P6VKQ8_9CHLO|nr:UBX domain-containing 2 isoform X1 [Micractinium conductrix]|eukprot:PSC74669.1 UBX domain-containing 2 isoform X1 [Micractinium conductrix]
MDPSEAVANFVAITGADEAAALGALEATGYNLEQAVNLFFAQGDVGDGGMGGMLPLEDDESMARRLQGEGGGGGGGGGGLPPALEEDEVRAPLPVRTERLYGDDLPRQMPRRPANPVPQNVVDAFRDFRAEAGGAGGSGAAAAGGAGGLAAMFEPPRDMLFHGTFDEAKAHAQEQGRWLIVNLQSTSEFASHRLNRDTWRNDMIQSLVENNFVLFQTYEMVEEAQKLLHFYRLLPIELPALLIIDPVTGAPMRQWNGFVDAERLTEELLPFLDYSIHDPGAARLARRARSRKDLGAAGRQPSGQMNEDEELQRALAMSLAGGGGAGGAGGSAPSSGPGTDMEEDETEQEEQVEEEEEEEEGAAGPGGSGGGAVAPARPAAEVQAEAAGRLPEEPGDGGGCRVAVRLPDGRRAQRRFPPAAPVAALYDFCLSQSEEAAGGRPFSLSQAFPGAPALDDQQQTVEAAGLHGAMLVLKWQD